MEGSELSVHEKIVFTSLLAEIGRGAEARSCWSGLVGASGTHVVNGPIRPCAAKASVTSFVCWCSQTNPTIAPSLIPHSLLQKICGISTCHWQTRSPHAVGHRNCQLKRHMPPSSFIQRVTVKHPGYGGNNTTPFSPCLHAAVLAHLAKRTMKLSTAPVR